MDYAWPRRPLVAHDYGQSVSQGVLVWVNSSALIVKHSDPIPGGAAQPHVHRHG